MTDLDPTKIDPTKITLTEKQVQGITYVQQAHLKTGQAPTAEKLAEVVGVTVETARKWYGSLEFKYMMDQLGIPNGYDSDVMLPQQVIILNSLLDLNDKRSKREKCEDAGISLAKLDAWMRDPMFKQHYADIVMRKFSDADPAARMALLKNIESGNQKAIEFFFEMTGQFQRSVRHDVNLEGFVSGLVEVLQARIQDPVLLEQIAGDMELLMQGKRPQLNQSYADVIEVPNVEVPEIRVPQLAQSNSQEG